MDELEDLFSKMIEENKEKISSKIKELVLREICFACYDILLEKAEKNQEMSRESLVDLVLEMMEKNAS